MTQVTVRLLDDATWLELAGGDPKGNDGLHKQVASWAGWRRMPTPGATSTYRARAWLAALQPLLGSGLTIAWSPEAKTWADAQTRAYSRREHQLQADGREPKALAADEGGRMPMPHQIQAIRALAEMGGGAGLKDDMGLGKTTSALCLWAKTPHMRRALVVCPKSVKLNWLQEIEACFNGSLPSLRVFLIDGTASRRADVLGYMQHVSRNEPDQRAIAIVNYDLLRSMAEPAWRSLEEWCVGQCLIADEFHYCKDLGSKRTKSVQALMRLSALRLGLTGTPVRNTVEDLFAQCELLRPGTWVSYHDFANRHLVVTLAQFGNTKRKVPIIRGGKNLEELNRVVNTMWVGRKKDAVLTLPPIIRTKPLLELDGLHADVYKAMKDFARVELEKLIAIKVGESVSDEHTNSEVSIWHPLARSAVEAAMRCEMIAQGFLSGIPTEYEEEVAPLIAGKAERVEGYPGAFVFPDSPKMAWILDVVENDLKDRQVVLFSRFNAPIMWLTKRLEKCAMLIGSMDAVARHETIQGFRRGDSRILCVQVKLAEGFNLTESTDVLFLGRDWSPAINAQAEARCHRIGTQGTVNVQIPIVQNSVERFIDRKLMAKDADAQQALKAVTLRELLEAL